MEYYRKRFGPREGYTPVKADGTRTTASSPGMAYLVDYQQEK
jgi:hypothetical protein